ncbi:hypothetical protein SLEP1_g2687 [Rubroshorea leprosula]|uniref:Uncharacterized protein n=1 Tax=Rubroshorea leprosula TaxID=152421 RepID=A0AAV5HHY5_9ROSI|nr:hypothetical protein SLEP1_g2687 [Rubroshorea leprosula]
MCAKGFPSRQSPELAFKGESLDDLVTNDRGSCLSPWGGIIRGWSSTLKLGLGWAGQGRAGHQWVNVGRGSMHHV